MSILAQGFPGAEPNDSTTVARTAGVPEFLAAMISSKISIFNSLKKRYLIILVLDFNETDP
jgi:hypothetical protein